MAAPRISGFILDVSDGPRAAAFWAGVFETEVAFEFDEYLFFDVDDIHLVLQVVPDPRVVKNRAHFDLTSGDPSELIERVLSLGGSVVSAVDKSSYALTVLADPDGNEFCVSRQPSGGLG